MDGMRVWVAAGTGPRGCGWCAAYRAGLEKGGRGGAGGSRTGAGRRGCGHRSGSVNIRERRWPGRMKESLDAAARREPAAHAKPLGDEPGPRADPGARRQPPDRSNERRGADALARCRLRGKRQCGRRPPLAGTPPQRRNPFRGLREATRLPSLLPSLIYQCSTRRHSSRPSHHLS